MAPVRLTSVRSMHLAAHLALNGYEPIGTEPDVRREGKYTWTYSSSHEVQALITVWYAKLAELADQHRAAAR